MEILWLDRKDYELLGKPYIVENTELNQSKIISNPNSYHFVVYTNLMHEWNTYPFWLH